MKNYLLGTMVCVLFLSCKNEKKYASRLIITDSISLPAEDYVLESSPGIDYFRENDSRCVFYITNNIETGNNEILIYDLDKKKLKDKVTFSIENGFPKSIHGYNFINKDSLIVGNIFADTMYIVNRKGKIIDRFPYTYNDIKTNQNLFKIFPRKFKPIIYNEAKFYFSPPVYFLDKKDILNKSFAFSYDLKTHKVSNLHFRFPKEYIDSKYFSPEANYCSDGSNVIYSPKTSNEIWITDFNHKSLRVKLAESDLDKRFLKYSLKNATMQEALYDAVYYSSYQDIIYDKYRKVYYRFFYPGINISEQDKLLAKKSEYYEVMSVIILDKDFNKIGETVFNDTQFRFYSHFITEKGLYLYSNIPSKGNYQSGKLKFSLLSLIKNE